MSTYREIVGKKIKKVSSDPSSGTEGEMWYNSTTGTLRGPAVTKAWSSASPQIYANFGGGRAGTQTAALGCGGYASSPNPPSGPSSSTSEYDGSSWTLHPASLNTARGALNGCGTQTAAAVFGGQGPYPGPGNATEEFDGSSWTSTGDLNAGRRNYFGAGTQTAALCAGGYDGDAMNESEEYNGSSWTAGNTLSTSVYYNVGTGTQTAALSIGGYTPPVYPNSQNETEEYNGTSWTAGGTMGTRRAYAGIFCAQTDALVAGGSGPPTSVTANAEEYDGTSWAEQTNLSVAKNLTGQAAGGTANSTAGVVWNGFGPADSPSANYGNNLVEEWNVSTNVITAGAWASGGALNTGRINVSMGGTQTAGIVLGGHTSPGAEPKAVETYNGSAFTSATAIGPYSGDYAAYAGSSTAGIIFGGAPYTTTTAEYNGSWTGGGALSTGRSQLMGAGTGETSAVAIGGFTDSTTSTTATEEYGGTSWTGGGAMSTQRGRGAGFGIETAALVVGGNTSPDTAVTANSEEYNGSSWTESGDIFTATGTYIGGWGTQTDGAIVGGANPSYVATTLGYDGTSWSTRPNAAYAAGRTQTAGADGSAGLRAGGGPNTSQRDGSEEFTGETSSANITNFTTS